MLKNLEDMKEQTLKLKEERDADILELEDLK